MNLAWLEYGGIYAVANIRGGGEYGEEWHKAGMRHLKQNTFNDFMAAADWLITHQYTSPQHLGIGGRSNGGLTAAACMVQKPEMFGAVMVSVGVLDLLRFPLFTVGSYWTEEYGDPENSEHFAFLKKHSPLHNIPESCSLPPTLICTADHDDRVHPCHSFKFAAALQRAQKNVKNPIILDVARNAGHGAGKPTNHYIDEVTNHFLFLAKHLGLRHP